MTKEQYYKTGLKLLNKQIEIAQIMLDTVDAYSVQEISIHNPNVMKTGIDVNWLKMVEQLLVKKVMDGADDLFYNDDCTFNNFYLQNKEDFGLSIWQDYGGIICVNIDYNRDHLTPEFKNSKIYYWFDWHENYDSKCIWVKKVNHGKDYETILSVSNAKAHIKAVLNRLKQKLAELAKSETHQNSQAIHR